MISERKEKLLFNNRKIVKFKIIKLKIMFNFDFNGEFNNEIPYYDIVVVIAISRNIMPTTVFWWMLQERQSLARSLWYKNRLSLEVWNLRPLPRVNS